jgi:multidrug resistance efflux pump
MSDLSLYLLTEAAERTGLTVEAIRQRIKRGRLEAVKGNDGLLRVRLTSADLESFANRSTTGHPAPTATGQASDDDRLANALQAAAAAQGEAVALREAMGRERERADKAEGQAASERAKADKAEAEREAARIATARAEGEAAALRGQVQAAEAARDGARAELADWTAGGPLGRAWRALIYRRGRP